MIRRIISPKTCVAIVLSLISIGCSRFTSEGETLIRGTATINGKEYVDITKRYWNTDFTINNLSFYPEYNMFLINMQLQPKDQSKWEYEYEISFCVSTEKAEGVKVNYPYKVEDKKSIKTHRLIPNDIIELFAKNRAKVINTELNDGIAIITDFKTNAARWVEGQFIIRSLDLKSGECRGEYTIKAPAVDGKEELRVNGKFETTFSEYPYYSPY
jgi:hypothetical protein